MEPDSDSAAPQPQSPAAASSLVGTLVSDRYRIERLIGEGGMGAVYQAEHTHLHKRLAVKVLHAEMSRLPEIVARFEREAMAASHIDHANVAAASDFGKLPDGSFFLVLEYIEGRNLREVLSPSGPLELGRALHIAAQIVEALARAHSLGIVHRDLKPENIMIIERDGDPDFVKVLDFGIAKVPLGGRGEISGTATARPLTQMGVVFGTPDYMAPEQALGQSIDGRADLYSVGVLLFEMLTGAVPFEHDNPLMVLSMQVTAAPPTIASKARGEIPAEVEAVVARVLAKEAGDRYDDARQLGLALAEATGRLVDIGRIAPVGPAIPSAPRSHGSLAAARSRETPSAMSPSSLRAAQFVASVETNAQRMAASARDLAKRTDKTTWLVAGGALGSLGLMVALVLYLVGGRSEGGAMNTTSTGSSSDASAAPPAERLDVHRDLERAAMASGDAKGALDEAGQWLKLDPSAASDVQLAADLRVIATGHEDPDSAVLLLSTMGSLGVDVLYDITYGTPGPAAQRAKKALSQPGVTAHASPALAVTMDLRAARGCDRKKALFDRARQYGDARTLVVLAEYQPTSGCGFLHLKDCWACMHRDDSLAATTAAIRARARAD